jgi:N-methylhydantoinase A
MLPLDHPNLDRHFRELEQRGQKEMKAEGIHGTALRSLDLRYAGQGYELNIESGRNLATRFHEAHQQRYGYSDPQRQIEIVNLRVRMVAVTKPIQFHRHALRAGSAEKAILKRRTVHFGGKPSVAPVYDRSRLSPGQTFGGPAVVVEYSATSAIPPGCRVRVDEWQNLIIEVENVERIRR